MQDSELREEITYLLMVTEGYPSSSAILVDVLNCCVQGTMNQTSTFARDLAQCKSFYIVKQWLEKQQRDLQLRRVALFDLLS